MSATSGARSEPVPITEGSSPAGSQCVVETTDKAGNYSGGVSREPLYTETARDLATQRDQRAVHQQDRVTPGREPHGAQLAARHDAALQQRLHLVVRQVDAYELDGL